MLALSASIESLAPPPVPTERRASMKARVVQAAAARQPTQAIPVARPAYASQPTVRSLPWLRHPVWIGAALAAVVVALVWWASASSLPDNPFYGTKLTTENVLLNLANAPEDQVRGYIGLADVRLSDLRTMNGLGKLASAGIAFDNYDYHLTSGFRIWKGITGAKRTGLARLLYTSSVAGQRTFSSFGNALGKLPASIQADITQADLIISDLNTASAQALRDNGIDPESLPTPSVPVMAVATPNNTAIAIGTTQPTEGTGSVSAVSTAIAEASQTAVISFAQTAVVVGNPSTPEVSAAQTMLAGGTGTPAAVAQQTIVSAMGAAHPELTTSTVVSGATGTATPTQSPTGSMTSTTTTTPDSTGTPTRQTIPSATASLAASTATRIPVPPASTIALPTATVITLPTVQPPPPPPPPPPASTPTSVTPSTCDLRVAGVDASCASVECVNWTATVRNGSAAMVNGAWTAELQINDGGGFRTVATKRGRAVFAPGDTPLTDSLCFSFPKGTNRIKVAFSVDAGPDCSMNATSKSIAPCLKPKEVSTSQLPQPPKPIKESKDDKREDGR